MSIDQKRSQVGAGLSREGGALARERAGLAREGAGLTLVWAGLAPGLRYGGAPVLHGNIDRRGLFSAPRTSQRAVYGVEACFAFLFRRAR